jgi:putative nucleotidyltransferase with HDIG domain
MCNGISRGGFLAAAGAAALPLIAAPASAAELPVAPKGLSAGNAHAAQIARNSHFIRTQYAGVLQLANSITDPQLRADVLDLIANPVPKYARKYQTLAERMALRDALAAKGFVKPDDPVSGIFPPGTDGSGAVQPFWSAPGSAYDSHHSYPGGLLVHELFNARMAEHFAKTYNLEYFNGQSQVDRDLVIAAAFYHDIMKTVVFQYNADGSLLPELQIAGTGGHHCLSGAEAIVRGHDARFVTVLLSAHAAPSLGDQVKVASWCRAAAIIAGVDPVEYGLLDRAGNLAALPPIEAFVSNLSDHDYVLSVHAMQQVGPRVEALAPYAAGSAEMRWWRHGVLANASAIALYEKLAQSEGAFRSAVRKAATA